MTTFAIFWAKHCFNTQFILKQKFFLNIFKDFLTNRKQRASVDEKFFSQFKSVVSVVPQGSDLGPLLIILYTADMWNDLEIKLFHLQMT